MAELAQRDQLTAGVSATEKTPSRESFRVWAVFISAIAALGAVYLAQVATPLRLDDDALDYLRTAAAMSDGIAIPTLPIPKGYPHMLSLLERGGLATSFGFVIVNCAFLFIGLYSAWRLRHYSVRTRQLAILGTLLAIPVIKSVTIALPDAVFFGMSMLAVSCLTSAVDGKGSNRVVLLVTAGALTIIAINLRYAGIALIPALAWSFFQRRDISDRSTAGRSFEVAIFGLLAIFFVTIAVTSRVFSNYVGQARGYYVDGPIADRLLDRAMVIVRSLGEVLINLPFSRLKMFGAMFVLAGIVLGSLVLLLVWRRSPMTPARVYLIGYLLLLILWPLPAPRLWIPIIPLIFAEATQGFMSAPRNRWTLVVAGAYGCWLTLTGVAALTYTTRISLSGNRFTQLYGNSGGMADPTIKEGNPSWPRVQFYNAEAKRMLARYGRR
ncbi:MAG: hypothetical protein ABR582_03300 [Gemmatimonadaceae bacterium]